MSCAAPLEHEAHQIGEREGERHDDAAVTRPTTMVRSSSARWSGEVAIFCVVGEREVGDQDEALRPPEAQDEQAEHRHGEEDRVEAGRPAPWSGRASGARVQLLQSLPARCDGDCRLVSVARPSSKRSCDASRTTLKVCQASTQAGAPTMSPSAVLRRDDDLGAEDAAARLRAHVVGIEVADAPDR